MFTKGLFLGYALAQALCAGGLTNHYSLEIQFKGKPIGASQVTLAHPGQPDEQLTVTMDFAVPIPFKAIRVKRTATFDRLPEGRCSRFHCVSKSEYSGYSFERWATNDGKRIELKTLHSDGRTAKRLFDLGRDFDIATGFRHPQVIGPDKPHRVLRFLDLHTGEVTRLDQTFEGRWIQTNAGVREPMIAIRTQWSFISQRSVRWETLDLPVSMELRIPFIGTSVTRLTSRSVTGVP